MLKVILENIDEELIKMGADKCGDPICSCGGGYGDGYDIHIDYTLPYEKMRLTTVHEVLDYYLSGRVRHSKIDQMAIDVIDALIQVGATPTTIDLPDNKNTEIEYL